MEEPTVKKNNTGMIIIGVVILLLIGGGILVMTSNKAKNTTPSEKNQQQILEPTTPEAMTDTAPTAGDRMMDSGMTGSNSAMQGNAIAVTIDASNFAFSKKEIRVKKGDTVKIILNNTQGMHDFVIDEFSVKTPVLSLGKTADVTFTANQAGTFEYYCSVGSHRQMGMVGKLIVE